MSTAGEVDIYQLGVVIDWEYSHLYGRHLDHPRVMSAGRVQGD